MKWIKHTGNEMPVSGDTLVLIKMRDGNASSCFVEASEYNWRLDDVCADIIEYALAEGQEQKEQEPQKTLRDEFAMAALTGLLSCENIKGSNEYFAKTSYEFADAMMKERTK